MTEQESTEATADFRDTKSRPRILVVDDTALGRQVMEDLLVPLGYEVMSAENGADCLEMARRHLPDLILLDVVMPVMDGFTACEEIKSDPRTRQIPVILVTSLEGRDSKLNGLSVGANDFLSKPIDKAEVTIRVKNLLRIKEFEDFLQQHNEKLDEQVRERTRQLSEAFEDLKLSKEALNRSYLDTILTLTSVAEYKDGFTSGHIKKVGHYCKLLAREIGWSDEEQQAIYYASPMHDIGKVAIPSDILLKPGRLTREEFALMKTHASTGAAILQGSNSHVIQLAERIALAHHERWDGTGYPRGLREDEIPLEGNIMNIADQYDALRSERPYKSPLSHDETFKILSEGDGRTKPSDFSPLVLETFRDSNGKFNDIFESFHVKETEDE
jgi:putative two-component system response regulator